jgi:hypothetical protein
VNVVEAPVLPCRGCGAPLAVDPEAVVAACGGCRAVTPVPEELRQRARAYRRSLGVERGKVEHARRSATDTFAKLGKYFGPPLAAIIVAHIIATMVIDASYQDYETWAFGGAMGLLGIAFFAWLGFGIRKEFRAAEAPETLPAAPPVVFEGSIGGTCSTCGGKVSFVIEQPNARCPYCGATVFPTPEAQQGLLALAAERADLEIGRASRAQVRSMAETFDGGVFDKTMSAMRWVGLATMPLVFVGIGLVLVFRDGLPDAALDALDIVGLVLMGAGVLLLVAIVGVVLLVRRLSRPFAIRRTLLAVSATAGGRVVPGVRPMIDWLDANWAATVPDDVLALARSDGGDPIRRLSVAFTFAGRPALLAVAHAPHVRRTDVFFALHKRRAPQQGQVVPAAYEVRSAGYALLVTTGGAHVIVLDSDPQAFAPEKVTWLLQRAAQVAQA